MDSGNYMATSTNGIVFVVDTKMGVVRRYTPPRLNFTLIERGRRLK